MLSNRHSWSSKDTAWHSEVRAIGSSGSGRALCWACDWASSLLRSSSVYSTRRAEEKARRPIKMADMVQQFSAVTLSNEIMNYEIYMTAAIVTKMNEGSSLIIIQQFIIFFKSFNLHREHRNVVNHLGSRLISSGCSIHRLRKALYREPLLLPEETNRTHLGWLNCDPVPLSP